MTLAAVGEGFIWLSILFTIAMLAPPLLRRLASKARVKYGKARRMAEYQRRATDHLRTLIVL